MAKSAEAAVERDMLIWARKTAGITIEQAAKKINVDPDKLESWEKGESRPTVNQLRNLGNVYHRALAVFYLPEPPKEFQVIRDLRRSPGQVAGLQSPELRLEIRRAHDRRDLALMLCQELGEEPVPFSLSANISDDAEEIASRIREKLEISYEDQIQWSGAYDALNAWRVALEHAGVLVFQAADVDWNEMRGFSISETLFPVIVVNVKDSPRARIFTMLHELSHIIFHEGGICDLEEEAYRPPEEQVIEVFCNKIAGAVLMPKMYLLQEPIVMRARYPEQWSDEEIDTLARRYGASREALLRRLLILGRTTQEFYQVKRRQYQKEYESWAADQEAAPVPYYRKVIGRRGRLFVQLVLNSYHQDKITASDVADFLEVRLKHLPKIENALVGSSY